MTVRLAAIFIAAVMGTRQSPSPLSRRAPTVPAFREKSRIKPARFCPA